MITNLPNSNNFKFLARESLIQAFNNLYQIVKDYNFSKKEGIIDFGENEIWDYHKGDLRSCLLLVYQGYELYLKSEICNESPLLLIETSRSDWPTKSNSDNKDFNDLFTISGEALTRTYNAIRKDSQERDSLNAEFEKIRKKRNVITHSAPDFKITPKQLIEPSIQIITFFEGKDQWWILTKQNHVEHPLFGYSDYDYELSELLLRLQFIKNQTSLGFLNKNCTIDLKSRKYLCPYCTRYLTDVGLSLDEIPKWTFLSPNTPDSDKVICFSCQQYFEVEREKCENEDCKGNVISDGYCLSCYG